jgi:MFS transporter, DHA1 family, tetracycline resistance protein
MSTAERQPTPPGFWTVWTAVAIDLLGFGIVIPLLPLYAERFEATPFTIGLLFASYSLAQFVFSPIWGRVSDRVGRRPVMLVTIAGSAIGSLVVGLAGSLLMLFIGRIIDGMSGASVAVARATVADVASPADRPRLMGLLGAAFGVGFVIGPAIGALATLFGPAVPFFVAAALSLINLVMAGLRLPETRVARPSAPPEAAAGPSSVVVRLVVLTFVAITAFSAFEATFALLADDRLAITEAGVALVFAGLGVVLVGTQGGLVGPLTSRLGESSTLRLGLVLNTAGFGLVATAAGWAMLLPGLMLLAVGQGVLTPTLSSAIAGAATADRAGTALGIQQSAGGLARVLGPVLGGALFSVSTSIPYVVAAGITLVVVPLVPATEGVAAVEAPLG